MDKLTLENFEQASELVKKVTLPTDLVYSEYFSSQTGCKVYLKPENMQYTGAYKVRGAYYKISTMTEEEREKGLITASAGNHAQGNVIRLEHNQFVSTNRNAAVELRITLEAFGTEHKHQIMQALREVGYEPREIGAKLY